MSRNRRVEEAIGASPRDRSAPWRIYLGPCLAAIAIGVLLGLAVIGGEFGGPPRGN